MMRRQQLTLPTLVLLVLINKTLGYEIDLSTANGYEWSAALPNKSNYCRLMFTSCRLINVFFLGIEVPGRVPGSIYTDLDEAEIFTGGPLLFRFNDLDYRWVSYEDWDYSLTFNGICFL